jgi:riboflavin kinase/FMN adenylyltransferase
MYVHYVLGPPAPRRPAALAIDDFDGGTRAQRQLAELTTEAAEHAGARAAALVLWPGVQGSEPALTTLDERIALVRGTGTFAEIAVLPYPSEGVRDAASLLEILHAWYDVRAVLALEPGALAGAGSLADACASRGLFFRAAPGEEPGARARILRLIAQGEVARAARELGHFFAVEGVVALGDKRGRLLGFPTANLRPDPRKMLPANGVYAVRVRLPGEDEARHPGVANIGVRPTFGEGNAPLIEVHLLDVALELYGLPIAVELVERLREERRFDGIDALKAQVSADAQRARELLAPQRPGEARATVDGAEAPRGEDLRDVSREVLRDGARTGGREEPEHGLDQEV